MPKVQRENMLKRPIEGHRSIMEMSKGDEHIRSLW